MSQIGTSQARGVNIPSHVAGLCSVMEFCFRFQSWANTQPKPISAKSIQSKWRMSRAAAYRWRAAYLASTGQYIESYQIRAKRAGVSHG